MTIGQDVAGVWGNFLRTPEAKAIIATAVSPSKEVIDKLLVAALAYTRGRACGSFAGFHQWGDLTFPAPRPRLSSLSPAQPPGTLIWGS